MGIDADTGASVHLVVFSLDEQRFALPVSVVDRVIRAVEVVPLPGVPHVVTGVINVQGRIIPVISLRRRLGLPERAIAVDDQFVIAHTPRRTVALQVDATDVIETNLTESVDSDLVVPHSEFVQRVVKGRDGLVLVYGIETLLSLEEEDVLHAAVRAAGDVA